MSDFNKNKYYVQIDGIPEGPFSIPELTRLGEQGKISGDTPVCTPDDKSWKPLKRKVSSLRF